LFNSITFSPDGRWLVFVTPDRTVYLTEVVAPQLKREVGRLRDGFEGFFVSAVSKPSSTSGHGLQELFAVCEHKQLILIAPEHDPLFTVLPLEADHLLGCDFLAEGAWLAAQIGDNIVAFWRVDGVDARHRFDLPFPKAAKTIGQDRQEDVDLVVTRDGKKVYGRSRNVPYAGWDLSQGAPGDVLSPLFTPQAPVGHSESNDQLGTWSSADSRWIAGLATNSQLYIWQVDNSVPRKVPHRASDLEQPGLEESPAFAFSAFGNRALVSNGRGALLNATFDQQGVSTAPVSRLGGRGYRLSALKDGTGWLASSSAEVQLVFNDGTTLSSSPVLNLITWVERLDGGHFLAAGTDTGMLRFRRVFKFWGISVVDMGWPETMADTSSPATSSRGAGGGDGGGDGN
jgi:WD40 repeat protein